jgi:hypothetical protein
MKSDAELTNGTIDKSLDETRKACSQEQRYERSAGFPTTDSSSQEIRRIQHANPQLICAEGYATREGFPDHRSFHPPVESDNAFLPEDIPRSL